MDTLHSVLRTIRGENKSRRDHLTVFREFLHHLDRIGRKAKGQGGTSRDKRSVRRGK